MTHDAMFAILEANPCHCELTFKDIQTYYYDLFYHV